MAIVLKQWVPSAAIQAQECGPEFLGVVDDAEWSNGRGFYRGYFSAFRIKAGKSVWFHFPLPTPVELSGKPLWLATVSLLWETLEGARIEWLTAQHGGMDRVQLVHRDETLPARLQPFDMPADAVGRIPETSRQLTEIRLEEPLSLRFGVQLCIMVTADEEDGVARFYGAGAGFADSPVDDDNVAGLERRDQELLDTGEETLAVDRAVDHDRRIDPVVAERCEEGQRLPVAMRHLGAQPLAPPAAAVEAHHVGLAQVSSMKTRRRGSSRP